MGQPKAPVFQGMKRSLSRRDRVVIVLMMIPLLVVGYYLSKLGILFQITLPIWMSGVAMVSAMFFERVFKL